MGRVQRVDAAGSEGHRRVFLGDPTLKRAQWNGSASPTDVVKALQQADGSWEFKCKDGSKFTKTKAEAQAGVGCMFGSQVEACAITNGDINNLF